MATGAAAAWVVKALASAVAGLEEAIGTPESLDLLFREFGRSLPDSGATFTTLTTTFTTLSSHLGALAAAADNLDPTTDTAAALAEQLAAVGTALTAVVTDIDRLTQNPPTASLPAPLNDPEFWRTFGERLLGNLAYGYMSTHAPGVLAVLRATGVATAAVLDDQGASVVSPAALNWDDIPTLLTNPAALIRQTYQWPTSFDHASLVAAVRQLVRSLGIEATMRLPDDAMLGMFWDQPMDATQASAPVPFSPVVFPLMSWSGSGADLLQSALVAGVIPVPDESRTGAPVGFALFLAADAGMSLTIPVTASFTLALGGGVDTGIYAAIRPTGTELLTGAGSAAATLTTALTGKPPAPWTVGDPGGIRLETSELSVTVTLAAAAGTGPSATAASATIEVDGSFGAYFDLSGADSFIASIIGGGTHSVHLNAGAVWSTRTGLRLKGGIAASSTGDGAPFDTAQHQHPGQRRPRRHHPDHDRHDRGRPRHGRRRSTGAAHRQPQPRRDRDHRQPARRRAPPHRRSGQQQPRPAQPRPRHGRARRPWCLRRRAARHRRRLPGRR